MSLRAGAPSSSTKNITARGVYRTKKSLDVTMLSFFIHVSQMCVGLTVYDQGGGDQG